MIKMISSMNDLAQIPESQLKAAYALNMCTVSVSQIVDFNDIYILEQEYEAILNNLNLEEMPKDEALLNTLLEILNTITFFRIQDIKKKQIDKKYQQRIKNAIWSAVPNISMIVSGSPITAVLGLATQIGTGYMNYRKEKANALSEKEDAEIELQITAIEQLNALRRELFSTAWRLADKHQFPDCLRLTEKQIKQYNNILMDNDEYRKYARFEAIEGNFYAYPPFWYNYAHTALYIASSTDDAVVKKNYLEKAHNHFDQFQKLNRFNILREDQITASADLEYVDLLMLDESPDYEKIGSIITDAVDKAGSEFDVLQLCAIDYLRIGDSDSAAKILKVLVNEDYNAVSNAKILSRLYVSKYMSTNEEAYADYKILKTRIDPMFLFPMPSPEEQQLPQLEESYLSKQKAFLEITYRRTIGAFLIKKIVAYNAVIPAPLNITDTTEYYDYTIQAQDKRLKDAEKALDRNNKQREDYIVLLRSRGFTYGYIDVLNSTIAGMEMLSMFRALQNHDGIIKQIEAKLRDKKKLMMNLQEKMDNGDFSYNEYILLVKDCSYEYFMTDFVREVREGIGEYIDKITELGELEKFESELNDFCSNFQLPSPDTCLRPFVKNVNYNNDSNMIFFNYDLVNRGNDQHEDPAIRTSMIKIIKDNLSEIINDPDKVRIFTSDEDNFNTYFDNSNLIIPNGSVYSIRHKALAVIDDRSRKDYDLILCTDGIRIVDRNTIRECVPYNDITYSSEKNEKLQLGYPDEYSNKNVKINSLMSMITKLRAESNKKER